jgi:hypothetical protein
MPARRFISRAEIQISRRVGAAEGSPSRALGAFWRVLAASFVVLFPGANFSLCGGNGGGTGLALAEDIVSTSPAPSTRPSTRPQKVIHEVHFIRVVVDASCGISLQGRRVSLGDLPRILSTVPDRHFAVLELAFSSAKVPQYFFLRLKAICQSEVQILGLNDFSYVRQQDFLSVGSPAKTMLTREGVASAVATGWPQHYPMPESEMAYAISFEAGKSLFLAGDNITITEIRGTAPIFRVGGSYQVKGVYTLASSHAANLGLFVTAGRGKARHSDFPAPEQMVAVQPGSGDFTLSIYIWYDGDPHVSFYSQQASRIGSVYFHVKDSRPS